MDYNKIVIELTQAFRGRRSQTQFNRILGWSRERVHLIENGKSSLKWHELIQMAERAGRDVKHLLNKYFVYNLDPKNHNALVKHAIGGARIADSAKELGLSRFKISRWLSSDSIPDCADMLKILMLNSLGLIDFLGEIAAPKKLPSLAKIYEQREAERVVYLRYVETSALVRMLETAKYLKTKRHDPQILATMLKIPVKRVEAITSALEAAGAIYLKSGHFHPNEKKLYVVDSHVVRPAISYWTRRIARTLENPLTPGSTSRYGVRYAALSSATYEAVIARYLEFYGDMTKIISEDKGPPERAYVMNFMFADLEELKVD